MRYGLLALSIAMLTSGAVAAQSALAISYSVSVKVADEPRASQRASYGSFAQTSAVAKELRAALR